ncbi:Phosphotransferase enzyme family protein [Sinosporangium album]|uniref:Phosphotransferase enzyme family protein n=1 Tax=Sinosporangium album TaxID=504805 RepID=A0A1G8CBU0_9ACTN|nr:aminoglycoside phosphotransferase family protein [Sinosporangium album]SDH42330.1 Phosphotransferase enzyme family protein [Sinosporangium album]
MAAESVRDLLVDLSSRYGDWCTPVVKPFSLNFRNAEGSAILKIYRGIDPVRRQEREIQALSSAFKCGLKTPQVLEAERLGPDAWVLVTVVPGRPLTLGKSVDMEEYLHYVQALTRALADQQPPAAPGAGWGHNHDFHSTSEYLTGMLSARARRTSWWLELCSKLADLDGAPLVHLHGDVKPEHILVEAGRMYVVDWEACARGPAVMDVADAVFHAVRDYQYDSVEGCVASALRALALTDHNMPPLLAWRVALWADRRRQLDIEGLPGQLMTELLTSVTAVDACTVLIRIVREMCKTGTPR